MRLRVLGIVLAGGKGTRLYPLTKERAKPAVPFGGKYRIVDFVLSNFINSGLYSIYVLTQFKSQSLLQHLSDGWQFGGVLKDRFVIPVPAQMRSADETWSWNVSSRSREAASCSAFTTTAVTSSPIQRASGSRQKWSCTS